MVAIGLLLLALPGCGKRNHQIPLTEAAPAVALPPKNVAENPGGVANKPGETDEKPAEADKNPGKTAAEPRAEGAAATDGAEPLSPRQRFNVAAAANFLPLFWRDDTNGDGVPQLREVARLWGFGAPVADERIATSGTWLKLPPAPTDPRQKLVLAELAQGRPTLVETDVTGDTDAERTLVREVLAAAVLIEQIHAKQIGIAGMEATIPATDPASRMLFYRNQGPWCVAPKTEKDPLCTAIAPKPKRVFGLYPAPAQTDAKFCETLSARKDAKQLMHQFHVVTQTPAGYAAVPYHKAFATEMQAIAKHLQTAARGFATDKKEAALYAYLLAAAKAFTDDSWPTADEAWAKMGARNSKWYLRMAPDEVYYEPCNRKAGFHVSFARINRDSLRWQDKLDPLKQDMEKDLAALAGAPYTARKVSFSLPDFIDIVINAGDSRSAHGATIGQSLPNWGPVANEGRGRTVAMTNLYTDRDSIDSFKRQAASLLCKETLATVTFDQEPGVMSTVLHEAAHNLGPAHEYKVDGKTDDEAFGGPLASTMEELKAQTAALWLNAWLQDRKAITAALGNSAFVRDMLWSFGHISRGMYASNGKPRSYSQLAAIQFGFMLEKKGIVWHADDKAANGKDVGCLSLDHAAFRALTVELMKQVAGIKARGDKAGAMALKARYVDDKGIYSQLRKTITDRWLRAPKGTFVYAVRGL